MANSLPYLHFCLRCGKGIVAIAFAFDTDLPNEPMTPTIPYGKRVKAIGKEKGTCQHPAQTLFWQVCAVFAAAVPSSRVRSITSAPAVPTVAATWATLMHSTTTTRSLLYESAPQIPPVPAAPIQSLLLHSSRLVPSNAGGLCCLRRRNLSRLCPWEIRRCYAQIGSLTPWAFRVCT